MANKWKITRLLDRSPTDCQITANARSQQLTLASQNSLIVDSGLVNIWSI